jgi:hypothetical protein
LRQPAGLQLPGLRTTAFQDQPAVAALGKEDVPIRAAGGAGADDPDGDPADRPDSGFQAVP